MESTDHAIGLARAHLAGQKRSSVRAMGEHAFHG
jgi:hypothetical protein